MSESRAALRGVARERVRHELSVLLLAPGAREGLELLRRTGIEAELVPGAAPDAAAVVGGLPADLDLRFAGWLRGTRPGPTFRRLRFSQRAARRVERLLRWHPLETGASALHDAAVRRQLRRVGRENVAGLIALRRAELEVGEASRDPVAGAELERLAALENAFQRVQQQRNLALRRYDLAIDGGEVIRCLGLAPGPEVGRALAHLTEQVIEDPGANTPERLRELLRDWQAAQRSE